MTRRRWQIEHPERPITANKYRTLHHHERADYDERVRGEIHWLARKARLPKGVDEILVTAHPIVRRGTTRADAAACAPTVKAAIDGLVDHGFIPDDGPDHVRGVMFVAPAFGDADRLVLVLEEFLDGSSS